MVIHTEMWLHYVKCPYTQQSDHTYVVENIYAKSNYMTILVNHMIDLRSLLTTSV